MHQTRSRPALFCNLYLHTAPICLAAQEWLFVTGAVMVLTLERFQADLLLWEATFKAEGSTVTQQMPNFPERICPACLVLFPLLGSAGLSECGSRVV